MDELVLDESDECACVNGSGVTSSDGICDGRSSSIVYRIQSDDARHGSFLVAQR